MSKTKLTLLLLLLSMFVVTVSATSDYSYSNFGDGTKIIETTSRDYEVDRSNVASRNAKSNYDSTTTLNGALSSSMNGRNIFLPGMPSSYYSYPFNLNSYYSPYSGYNGNSDYNGYTAYNPNSYNPSSYNPSSYNPSSYSQSYVYPYNQNYNSQYPYNYQYPNYGNPYNYGSPYYSFPYNTYVNTPYNATTPLTVHLNDSSINTNLAGNMNYASSTRAQSSDVSNSNNTERIRESTRSTRYVKIDRPTSSSFSNPDIQAIADSTTGIRSFTPRSSYYGTPVYS